MERKNKPKTNIAFSSEEFVLGTIGSDPYLVVNKRLLRQFGPVIALFINNLVDKYRYFNSQGTLDEQNGFYLTYEDQQYQTGIKEGQLRKCKNELINIDILKTKMKGIPPKEYYYLNFEKLAGVFLEQAKEKTEKPPDSDEPLKVCGTNPLRSVVRTLSFIKNKYNNNNILNNMVESTLPNIVDPKKKEFVILASKLADIVKSIKNINITPSKITSWANEIKKLSNTDGVSKQRIEKALEWYQSNAGDLYVPVIESGRSLRDKFTKLEDAMKRSCKPTLNSAGLTSSQDDPVIYHPRKIMRNYFKNKDLADFFYQGCYIPAEELFSDNETLDKDKLAGSLIYLFSQIDKMQEEKLTPELSGLLPGPTDLVTHYISWIGDNEWITNKSIALFDINHVLFGQFRRDEASKDNAERDPLTGQSYMRG